MDRMPTASLDNICATIVDQSTKDANAVIDELKKMIENFEKEKMNAEIENMKNPRTESKSSTISKGRN